MCLRERNTHEPRLGAKSGTLSPVLRQRRAFHQVTTSSLAEITGDARIVHTLVSRAVRFNESRRGIWGLPLHIKTLSRQEALWKATTNVLSTYVVDNFPAHLNELMKSLTREDIHRIMLEIQDSARLHEDILLILHLQQYLDSGHLDIYVLSIPRLLQLMRKR